MLDRTSLMAWLNWDSGRFCSVMAAVKASITVPSSATVVPAMSRQATVILTRTSPPLSPGNRSCRARPGR